VDAPLGRTMVSLRMFGSRIQPLNASLLWWIIRVKQTAAHCQGKVECLLLGATARIGPVIPSSENSRQGRVLPEGSLDGRTRLQDNIPRGNGGHIFAQRGHFYFAATADCGRLLGGLSASSVLSPEPVLFMVTVEKNRVVDWRGSQCTTGVLTQFWHS
jgi:hypothetical protein